MSRINRAYFTISNSPGTAGALTVSSAVSGPYRTLGAAQNGLVYDVSIVEGSAWEVRTNCTYTHSGTSLSRGTLEDSSTGSAINFTSAAVVLATESADTFRRYDSAALSQIAGANANTTMEVGALYVVDGATLTADRTYTLPATAAVGDRVGVMMSAGSASWEVLITAASGDTLNGVAGGTEWSRLFITGETVIMRCVVANTTWVVEQDGRIAQKALLSLTTSASGETASTFVRPTNFSGAWTARTDVGSIATASSGEIRTRRGGSFELSFFGSSTGLIADTQFFSTALYVDGTTNILCASTFTSPGGSVGQQAGAHVGSYPLNTDQFVVYQYRSSEGSKGLSSSAAPRVGAWFSLTEVL